MLSREPPWNDNKKTSLHNVKIPTADLTKLVNLKQWIPSIEKSRNQLVVYTICKHAFQVECIDIKDGVMSSSALLPVGALRTWENSQGTMRTDERLRHKVKPTTTFMCLQLKEKPAPAQTTAKIQST